MQSTHIWIRFSSYFLCASVFSVAPASATQDSTLLITDRIVCPGCFFDLISVAAIGDTSGPGGLAGEPKFLLRLPDGRYVTAEYPVATRLVVFRPDGAFERVIGRMGEGPGAFRDISAAYITAAGHLHVFDRSLRRETEFDARLNLMGITPMPDLDTHQISIGPDRRVYYNADVGTADHIALPIHLVDGGRIVRSFGSQNPVHDASRGGVSRPGDVSMGRTPCCVASLGRWFGPWQAAPQALRRVKWRVREDARLFARLACLGPRLPFGHVRDWCARRRRGSRRQSCAAEHLVIRKVRHPRRGRGSHMGPALAIGPPHGGSGVAAGRPICRISCTCPVMDTIR